jgi:hypothetical protein
MAGYIYLPVATDEMKQLAKEWTDGQERKGKKPYKVLFNYEAGFRKGFVRKIGRGVLRDVAAGDKIYVLAHGYHGGAKKIGAERNAKKLDQPIEEWEGEMKAYTPKELAEVIDEEGLIKSFVDLRLFACGTGLPAKGETQSYAEQLVHAMRARGYPLIEVTGYLGATRQYQELDGKPGELGQHKVVEMIKQGKLVRAKDAKVVFGRDKVLE